MIQEQIEQDYKTAFKAKDEIGKSALSNLKAAVKSAEIDKREPLSDQEVIAVIAKKVKQHKDSIEGFKAGNRQDLVDQESAQMALLQKYLPAAMSEEDLTKIIKQVIADSSATAADFGKVMKEVMAKVKGQADGSTITKIVKENLSAEGGSASGGKLTPN
jgi:uncharacterized protein YqeY